MPKTAEKRTERVQVMLTPEEFEFLQEYASAVGMPVEELFSLEGAPVSDWAGIERQIETRWQDPSGTS